MRNPILLVLVLLVETCVFGSAQSAYPSSGNQYVDQMIGFELNLLASTFNVRPSFSFIDDWGAPNAFASVNGEVFLGLELIQRELGEEMGRMGNYTVFVVLAHEFGHIASFQAGWHEQMSGVQMEIAADFLAGWYMARRSLYYPTDPLQGMRSLFRKGDYEFNNPGHHGTPEERSQAYIQGTNLGQYGISVVMNEARQYALANARGGTPLSAMGAFGCSLVSRF